MALISLIMATFGTVRFFQKKMSVKNVEGLINTACQTILKLSQFTFLYFIAIFAYLF